MTSSHRPDARYWSDSKTAVAVARKLLKAYVEQDRVEAERLLAGELTFTSPQDDHIDRDAYFERCFPTADRLRSQTLLYDVALDDAHAAIVYEYVLQSGERFRNTEIITVRNDQAIEIQVFFGGVVRALD
jgi:hypothetical protein